MIRFDAWKEGKVAPTHHELDIVAPKPGLKLEAVSSRLRQSLIHPSRRGILYGLRYVPDGKRLLAGDIMSGLVQVWDAETGKELSKVETGSRGWFRDQLSFTPGGKTLYTYRETRRSRTRVEKDGKQTFRWECAGDVRAWDLDTGKLRRTLEHTLPRGIYALTLSPDGSTFVTFEHLSGESDHGPKTSAGLWDVKTGHYRPLPAGINSWVVFTPDGKTLAARAESEEDRTNTIKLIDVASARERVSIPLGVKEAGLGYIAIAPDGKLLVGDVRGAKSSTRLGLWDPETGRAVGSLEGEGGKDEHFLYLVFSPDSRTLAVTNWVRSGPSKLFLFDLPGRRLVKTLLLAQKAMAHRPVFSPDGKLIAVSTQEYPDGLSPDLPAEDIPQPRIHLIDVAARVVRKTLVAPQGIALSACFSPDGRTLATTGNGRVLLWDLTGLAEPMSRK